MYRFGGRSKTVVKKFYKLFAVYGLFDNITTFLFNLLSNSRASLTLGNIVTPSIMTPTASMRNPSYFSTIYEILEINYGFYF